MVNSSANKIGCDQVSDVFFNGRRTKIKNITCSRENGNEKAGDRQGAENTQPLRNCDSVFVFLYANKEVDLNVVKFRFTSLYLF